MEQLLPIVAAIHDAGAELVVIGNGKPHFAEGFREEVKLSTPIYTDPEQQTYKLLGLKNSKWAVLNPARFPVLVRQLRAGKTQIKGDPWQQGGVFIIMPDGKIPYSYISEAPGDHPEPKDVLAALRKAVK